MSDWTMAHIAHEYHGYVRVPARMVDGYAMLDDDIRLHPEAHTMHIEAMAQDAGIDHHIPIAIQDLPPDLRDALVIATRWPGRIVHYSFFAPFTPKDEIMKGIEMWEKTGIFHFVEGRPKEGFLEFNTTSDANSSKLGRDPDPGRDDGGQAVNLTDDVEKGTVAHEIGHALGLPHEHKRRDAQSYVGIDWNKIDAAKYDQFTTRIDALKVGYYDFGSIMHYSRDGSSTPTPGATGPVRLEPFDKNAMIGQRDALAMSDLNAATAIYAEAVSKITVELKTDNRGTDDEVFLGLGGREFLLKGAGTKNRTETFVLGGDQTGGDAAANDPTNPPLSTSHVLGLPAYIRLAGDNTVKWSLLRAKVTLAVHEVHADAFPGDKFPDSGKFTDIVYTLPPGISQPLGSNRNRRAYLMRKPTGEFKPHALANRKIDHANLHIQLKSSEDDHPRLFLGWAGRESLLSGRSSIAPSDFTEGQLQEFPAYLYWEGSGDLTLAEDSKITVTLHSSEGDSPPETIELEPALTPLRLSTSCGNACQLKYKTAPRHHSYPPTQASTHEAFVRRIEVSARLGGEARPGTGDSFYLGLGGREFRLANGAGDFASGGSEVFFLGQDPTVLDAPSNDPRARNSAAGARLTLLDVDTYPTYLRKEGPTPAVLTSVTAQVTFEGSCRDPLYWAKGTEGETGSRFPTLGSASGKPMAVHLTGVYDNLPLGGKTGGYCALVRTLES